VKVISRIWSPNIEITIIIKVVFSVIPLRVLN